MDITKQKKKGVIAYKTKLIIQPYYSKTSVGLLLQLLEDSYSKEEIKYYVISI